MTAKHTPGWNITWEKRDKTWPGLFQLKETGPLLYGMDGEEGIYTNNENVFRLIAAAPEILDLCIALADRLRVHSEGKIMPLEPVQQRGWDTLSDHVLLETLHTEIETLKSQKAALLAVCRLAKRWLEHDERASIASGGDTQYAWRLKQLRAAIELAGESGE